MSDEQIASAPVLVLGNKIDVPGAASEDEIRHMFGLHGKTTGKVSNCANDFCNQLLICPSTNVIIYYFELGRNLTKSHHFIKYPHIMKFNLINFSQNM